MEHSASYRVDHSDVHTDGDAVGNTKAASIADHRIGDGSALDSRPSKVARTDRLGYRGASVQAHANRSLDAESQSPLDCISDVTENQGQAETPTVRTRGFTACNICRSRKTKCDNQRPVCGYCRRIGGTCTYLEPEVQSSSCHVVAPQLLRAINSLTALLEHQAQTQQHQHYQPNQEVYSPREIQSIASAFSESETGPDIYSRPSDRYQEHPHHNRDGIKGLKTNKSLGRENNSETLLHAGLESVLQWKIFSSRRTFQVLSVEGDVDTSRMHKLPNISYTELMRLEARYIEGVHTKNPILDLQKLHQMICQVAENGLDWSTSTCLVALVCALGAATQSFPGVPGDDPEPSGADNLPPGDELELGTQFFTVAAKRIGFAIGQNNLEAVQCLCLTGIWYMVTMQPLQAWKYFSLAGNAWYSATLKRKPNMNVGTNGSNNGQALTLEQSLYFTTYKSECEIRVELTLPGSILEDMSLTYDFPLPPSIPTHLSDSELYETERWWYFYLAEIASRHLINRILRAPQRNSPLPPFELSSSPSTQSHITNSQIREIRTMLAELDIFLSQLNEWYISLPPRFTFQIPALSTPSNPSNITTTTIPTLPDELRQILRSRYLTIRELCYRPFIHLMISTPLSPSIPPSLLSRITLAANEGLQYCVWKIQPVVMYRHHGFWFMLRNITTAALILIAANMAARDDGVGRSETAKRLILPKGWREEVVRTRKALGKYYGESRSGIWECGRILQWALDGCEPGMLPDSGI